MTNPIVPRLSPNGKFIGDPPWTIGSGSDGVILRKAGSGSPQEISTITPTTISGLDDVPVEILPGCLYELDLVTEVVAVNMTATGSFYTCWRLREKISGFWGPWWAFDAPTHYQQLIGSTGNTDACYRDRKFAVSNANACDRIQIGVVGALVNGVNNLLQPANCYLRVVEHLP